MFVGETRSLLRTQVGVGSAKLSILNTHNESQRPNSQYRCSQLKKCISIFQSLPSDGYVILCGSLNVRDWEVKVKLKK